MMERSMYPRAGRLALTIAMVLALVLGTGSWAALSAPAAGPIDQVHLAWVNDPATTMTVIWHTADATAPSEVEYRLAGTMAWTTVSGATRASGAPGVLHEAEITGLTPNTTYEYRVSGPNNPGPTWSDVFTMTTAPAPGAADFEVVYVADTGITGRLDGLTTGTEEVISAIDNLDPLLILGGGDYAFYNTDTRFTTLDQSIDAWFNQNEPIFTDRPFMPSYGNHEYSDADDADGYDEWAARFATPPGFNGQQFYSFDVGTAHFVSLYVPTGTINAEQQAWLSADLAAANAAGQRWIIPYFHIPPFSDGTNHSSSLSLRNELGPIFEQYGVQVVLTAHDQSYERTYPLVGVPSVNAPTSTNLSCYAMEDGVVWVKASPGGKLSNVNWNYSDFKTQPQPYWTAVRSNEQHHFVQLEFNPDGSLRVNVYGVTGEGDGTTPSLVDSFLITDQPCGAELAFDMPVVEETLDFDDAPVEMDVNLRAIGGTLPGSFTLSGGASWLTYSQLDADTVHLQADPSGLAPGIYTAEVLADSAGYRTARTLVILHVRGNTGGHEIELSLTPDRLNPVPLHNQTVSGEIYAFVPPEAVGIVQVRFLLNGSRFRAEGNLPYDLAGSAPDDSALPFDTSTLPNGENNVTAVIVYTDGSTEVASATFNVLNVETAPVGVTLSGPAAGEIDIEYTFTATVDPISATTPLTYVWSIDGSPTITFTGGISDTEAFLWPTPGIKTVAVTVSNAAGEVSDSVTIDIQGMVVQDQSLYLPIVRKADGQP